LPVSLSLETTKKGGSVGGFFLNHGFSELGPENKGKQGPKGPRKPEIIKNKISQWDILTRADWALCFESYGLGCGLDNGVRKFTKRIPSNTFRPKHYIHTFKSIVQGRPPSYQKNTVVWGDFSYGY
jgi:hypothetical protein